MNLTNFQQSLINRIRVDISVHKINTYKQCADALQYDIFILFPSLKPSERITVAGFNSLIEMLPALELQHHESLKLSGKMHGTHELDSLDWLPPPNPKQVATCYPHQTKAAKDIAYRLFIENKRGILLQAAAGDGKTFIYMQVIRWLVDKGWFKDCYSPWKCLIITKSAQETLVFQTQHVAEDYFGLKVPMDVYVLSYDALRSSKGLSRMIKKEKRHEDGELKTFYKWIEFLNPKLVIVDESQAAKNRDSIQSKVIRAMAEITEEGFKCIFSSATAFTKVAESEYLCVNVGVEL